MLQGQGSPGHRAIICYGMRGASAGHLVGECPLPSALHHRLGTFLARHNRKSEVRAPLMESVQVSTTGQTAPHRWVVSGAGGNVI